MKNGKRRNIDSRTRKTAAAPPPDPRDAEIASLRSAVLSGLERLKERDKLIGELRVEGRTLRAGVAS